MRTKNSVAIFRHGVYLFSASSMQSDCSLILHTLLLVFLFFRAFLLFVCMFGWHKVLNNLTCTFSSDALLFWKNNFSNPRTISKRWLRYSLILFFHVFPQIQENVFAINGFGHQYLRFHQISYTRWRPHISSRCFWCFFLLLVNELFCVSSLHCRVHSVELKTIVCFRADVCWCRMFLRHV